MAKKVVFIDTSVLLNVLGIPKTGNDHEHAADRHQFEELINQDVQVVLPLTTIIETGNAIAGIAGDKHRWVTAYVRFLQATLDGEAPWTTAGFPGTAELLRSLLTGTGRPLDGLLREGVGTGDASILAEMRELRSRLPGGMPIELWTNDRLLHAST